MDLFEWGNGEAARDEGIGRVVENTPEAYKLRLQAAFWYLVGSGEAFTAEDARPFVGDPPNHPNAYGGLWFGCVSRAMKEGYVELVGHKSAERTRSHKCDLKIYRGISRGVEVEGF